MENYDYQTDGNGKVFNISGYPHVSNNSPSNDCLVEVNSRSKLSSKIYKIISIICVIIVLIFLIFLLILLVFYLNEKNRVPICTSDECLRSAANLKYSLDLTANPCDDFYKYTCGHWSEEHPNHGWFPTFSTFSTISEKITISSVNFLTSTSDSDEPKPVKQSRDLYKSCMNIESINKFGYSVLYKYLDKVKLPRVPSMFDKSGKMFDWLETDVLLKKYFAMDVFIGFMVAPNNLNNSENVMYFGVPNQRSPLPSPLKKFGQKAFFHEINEDDEDLEEKKLDAQKSVLKFIFQSIIKNLTRPQPNDDILVEAVDVVFNISDYMEELIANHSSYNYVSKPYTITKLQDLTNEYLLNNNNKQLPKIWEKYVDHIFKDTNITINLEKDLIYIEEDEFDYIPRVVSYILTLSNAHLELYMWCITVFTMIFNTSTEVIQFFSKQMTPFSHGTTVSSRSLDCANLVSDFMSLAVSYGVADKTFTNTTKPRVEEMLYNIKNAFVERVNSITWMDRDTKRATLEKSREMASFIGYPDWLFDREELEEFYEGINIEPDTYLENMMSIIGLYFPSQLETLRMVNERDWTTNPITVNAFNSFSDNAINVPMAILSYPIYNLGLEVLNYGAIGSILGHELTHGFDNWGRKHDKFGNFKQWWSNETIEIFEQKTKCFVAQYDNYTIAGIDDHINGEQTLGENLADNGGLSHAYLAYQNYLRKYGQEKRLPGFENFTSNQLFFIAYGSIWCETLSLDDLKNQIKYDEHCPNSVRVKGTLQNSKEFAKAFNCPVGSGMNPKKNKCEIW